jgi:transposase-like protein
MIARTVRNARKAEYWDRKARQQMDRLIEIAQGIRCPWCGSVDFIRFGHYQQNQRYMCKRCGRKFGTKAALPHMQTPAREVGDALSTYFGGMSLRAIQRHLDQQYRNRPSDSTIYRWLVRFSKVAITTADKHVPSVGDEWVADETMLKIGGEKVWLWDIIDAKTRFLLATKLSRTRTTNDAFILMQRASNRAGGKVPRVVLTDALAAYLDGIEWSYGSDTKHVQTKPFTVEQNTNLIERFHGTLKDRTRVMRGMKRLDTANLFLQAWLVHYNYFRPHESLGEKTPGEAAGVHFDYSNWLDLVQQQHKPTTVTTPPVSRPWVRSTETRPWYERKVKKPTHKKRTAAKRVVRTKKPVYPELGEIRMRSPKTRRH